ncbi:contact-dependent growth inhibition system immunity protein [Streptomyces sp. NPDC054849]
MNRPRLLHLDRTLDELDGPAWAAPPPHATALVTRIHALRRRPLCTLTPADLRTLVAQSVCLPYVLPLAVALLLEDPMLDAYFYEGDLLLAALALPAGAWAPFPDLAAQLTAAVEALSAAATAELARLAGPEGLGLVGV